MTQLHATMKVQPTPAKDRAPMIVAVLAAVLTIGALVAAAILTITAAQERSGIGMVYAGAAWLVGALSLMVAIHSWRS